MAKKNKNQAETTAENTNQESGAAVETASANTESETNEETPEEEPTVEEPAATTPNEHTLKVGDRVKCLIENNDFQKGEETTVTELLEFPMIKVKHPDRAPGEANQSWWAKI